MRTYVKQGIEYLLTALILAAVLTGLSNVLQQRRKKPSQKEKRRRLIVAWYFLTVILVAFGDRNQLGAAEAYRWKTNLFLFENLRSAIRERSAVPVIQTGLNFGMFVPGGLILCWVIGQKRCRLVYILLPLISLFLETVQLCTGWGLFDVDDLFWNTLGGYWGVALFQTLVYRSRRSAAVSAAIPALAASVGIVYAALPFGLLPEDVINTEHIRPKTVILEPRVILPQTLAVYRTEKEDKEDAIGRIEAIFEAVGTTVDLNTKDEYDTCVILRGVIPVYYIWYDFDGTFQLQTGERGVPLPGEGTVEERVLELLDSMGYHLPEEYFLEKISAGKYRLSFDMVEHRDSLYDGSLSYYVSHETLFSLAYDVREVKFCTDRESFSEQVVQERLLRGHFSPEEGLLGPVRCIEVKDSRIVYREDSKGYYRPCYSLHVFGDGCPMRLLVPAV